jgi:hypothetical protein
MSVSHTHTPEGMAPSLAMPTTFGSMTNTEVIASFEADNLSGEFHHAEHVRLAFAYLSEFPAIEALHRFSVALKQYAAARGKPDRYHETVTYAYLFLIRERMARTPRLDWDAFIQANTDLLRWKPGILDRYYCQSTLRSDLAREVFLFPDKIAEL